MSVIYYDDKTMKIQNISFVHKKVLLEMRPRALKVLFDILGLGSSINYNLFVFV